MYLLPIYRGVLVNLSLLTGQGMSFINSLLRAEDKLLNSALQKLA